MLHTEEYLHALGARTGTMAVQQIHAGLKAVYLSDWRVAADANTAGQMYPNQSLYRARPTASPRSSATSAPWPR